MKCIVCETREGDDVDDLGLCTPCGKSYDKAASKDATTWALLVWACKRVRSLGRSKKREASK